MAEREKRTLREFFADAITVGIGATLALLVAAGCVWAARLLLAALGLL